MSTVFSYPIESFGFNYRDNGYNRDGLASTVWKVAHYTPVISTIMAIFDLVLAYKAQDYEVRDRSMIAFLPVVNLILIPLDLFFTLRHIYNACITAD